MGEMRDSTGLDDDRAEDTLLDTNFEYQDLADKSLSLKSDLNRYLISIKGHPLVVTNEKWVEILDTISDYLNETISEEELNRHFEIQLLAQNQDISRRAKQVKWLYLQGHLHKRNYNLYSEAINCYIYGFYNASCMLCRTISELIAKRYIQHRGDGDLLCGTEKDKKQYTIPGLLSKLSVPKEILQLYRNIHSKADKIIHEIDEKTSQEEALKIIKTLQELIKNFPKCI
jgi:hypothetical protein